MVFSLNIDATKLQAAFDKAALAVGRELRVELGNALDVVRRDASVNHRFKSGSGHSGNLQRSIQKEVAPTGLSGAVLLKDNVAVYGKYIHEGTGKYGRGRGEYKIMPKNKKALHWVSGGNSHFSKGVTHPGIKPDPFLYQAFDRQKPDIMARLRGAVSRVLQMAGLK